MTGYFALYIAFTVRIVDKAYINNLSESLAQFLDSYFLDQTRDNEVIGLGWLGGVSGVGLTVRNSSYMPQSLPWLDSQSLFSLIQSLFGVLGYYVRNAGG